MASTEVSGTGSIASLQDVSPSSRSTAERASHVAPEEEQPATTDGEIWSWYVYDIGTSVYGAPAMAMLNALLTVRLTTWHACERLSEETPHYCDKDGQPVSGKAGVDKDDVELQTDLLNLTPASVTFLSIGVGVMCQAVAYISFSSYADFGQNRHRLLFRSCVVGVLFAFLFLLCFDSSTWWLASALMILTGVFHGLSIVFYNAYLPLMVRNHPEYTAIQKQQEQTPTNIKNEDIDIINCKGEQDENPNSTSGPQPAAIAEASLATTTSPDDSADPLTLREQSISNHFSTMGFYYGYLVSALACVVVSVVLLFTAPKKDSSRDHYADKTSAVILGICSAWCALVWLACGIRCVLGLQKRAGPDLESSEEWVDAMGGSTKVNLFSAVIFSWKRTWRTIRMLFQPEHHVLRGFMIAYFFFSDGYSTIINVGIIYAQTELNISTMWLGVILVEVVFFNMVGVRFYRWLFEERFSMRLQQALLILLYQYIAISVLAFLILQFGLIPLFFFGFSHGMLLGAVMATTRALFSSLVPHGLEAQFFALYAISDKGSSWIGPCVVAVMSQFASVRYGILWVVVALAVGAFILCRLPLDEVLAQKRKSQRTSSSYTRENAAPDQVGSSSAAE